MFFNAETSRSDCNIEFSVFIDQNNSPAMAMSELDLRGSCFSSSIRKLVICLSAFLILFLQSLQPLTAQCTGASPTWTSTIDQSSVQSCISQAASGDTINISPGSASWSKLSIPSAKGLTLACPTPTCSISGATAVIINQGTAASSRVTGFTFTTSGGSSNPTMQTIGDGSTKMARIDDNTFTSNSSGTWIETDSTLSRNGYAAVLIDHNTLSAGSAAEMIHVVAYGPEAGESVGWTNDVVPGSPNMTFIETNTANCTSCSGQAINNLVQSYYGARTVIRYNTLNYAQIDQHGTSGLPWARWWEIYDNTFNGLKQNPSDWMELRGGSGVIWGNTFENGNTDIGFQDNTCGAYPDPMQIGRGINQASSPAYLWGNGPSANYDIEVEQCTSDIQINRDYFVSTSQPATLERCESAADVAAGCPVSYTYQPYPYPFPLNSSGLPVATTNVPSAPTNLGATVTPVQ